VRTSLGFRETWFFVHFANHVRVDGHRLEITSERTRLLLAAIDSRGVTVIDCPVDYREYLVLTERLGLLVCRD
jgi:thiamine pyrophosphate-dependent acetolactate synthase large subunit-like protein